MDKALAELVRQGLISFEEALSRAHNPETLRSLLGMPSVTRQSELLG